MGFMKYYYWDDFYRRRPTSAKHRRDIRRAMKRLPLGTVCVYQSPWHEEDVVSRLARTYFSPTVTNRETIA